MRWLVCATWMLLPGCIVSYAVTPEPEAGTPASLGVDLSFRTEAAEAADLTAGIEETLATLGATPATQPQPYAGMGVEIRIKAKGWLAFERIWHLAAAFTLFVIPAFENDYGYDVEMAVYGNGNLARTYQYEVLRNRVSWLLLGPVAWLSLFMPGERDAGREVALQFLRDATADGVLRPSTLASAPPLPKDAAMPLRATATPNGVRLDPPGRTLGLGDFYSIAGRPDLAWEYRLAKERNRDILMVSGAALTQGAVAAGVFGFYFGAFHAARETNPGRFRLCGDLEMTCAEVGYLAGLVVSAAVALVGGAVLAFVALDDADPLEANERRELIDAYNLRLAAAAKAKQDRVEEPPVVPEPDRAPQPEPTHERELEAEPPHQPVPLSEHDQSPEPEGTPAPEIIGNEAPQSEPLDPVPPPPTSSPGGSM